MDQVTPVPLPSPGQNTANENLKDESLYCKCETPECADGENLCKKCNLESFKGTYGGKRPNAGRPFGSMNKKTKELKVLDEEFRGRILNSIHDLLTAQFNIAKGASYLYRIDVENGEKHHFLVEDPDEIKNVLDECEGTGTFDEHYYYITTKAPDNRALDSLIDRVFGKVPQKSDVKLSGVLEVITGMKVVKEK